MPEEDTIFYDEIDFYLDTRRRIALMSLRASECRRSKPLLYVDLDHYFEDSDSMMA
ncbi:MAG: hypothetical protein QW520_01355 [Methanomassiliicoccales archaeon]